jgi:hypothetical protein
MLITAALRSARIEASMSCLGDVSAAGAITFPRRKIREYSYLQAKLLLPTLAMVFV